MAKKKPDLDAIDRAMAKPPRTKEETHLRDVFAMHALPAVYAASLARGDELQETIADEAYELADRMLIARQQR